MTYFEAPDPTRPRAALPLAWTSPMPLILGVDIGAAGGLALLTAEGDLLDVEPMPVLPDGPVVRPGKRARRRRG